LRDRRAGLMRYEARHFIDSMHTWADSLLTQATEAETDAAKSALEAPVAAERALACKRTVDSIRFTFTDIKLRQRKYGTFSDTKASLDGLVDIVEEMMDLCSTLHGQWRMALEHARKAAEMAGEGGA